MSNSVYKKIEIVGTSSKSQEDAIESAIAKAAETVHNMRWFKITDTRGYIEDNQLAYYQVTLNIGFTVE